MLRCSATILAKKGILKLYIALDFIVYFEGKDVTIKFIGDILRKDHNRFCNTSLSWTSEGRREDDPKTWRKQTKRRERERMAEGDPRLRPGLRPRTEIDGDVLLMPYVQQSTKQIGKICRILIFTIF